MARFLIYRPASSGNVFPAVDMLLGSTVGHQLDLAGGASEAEQMDARESAPPRLTPASRISSSTIGVTTQIDALRRMFRAYADAREFESPRRSPGDLEVRPDALVVDVNCHGAIYAAEASGCRWRVLPPTRRVPLRGRPSSGFDGARRVDELGACAIASGRSRSTASGRELRPFNRLGRSRLRADREAGRALPQIRHLHRLRRRAVRYPRRSSRAARLVGRGSGAARRAAGLADERDTTDRPWSRPLRPIARRR